MKKSKILIAAAIVAAIALSAVLFSACVVEDTQVNDALALVSQNDYLKVEVADENGTFYVYDNGKVTDVYNLGIRFEDVVGEKGQAVTLTLDNLKEGYECEKDVESGEVSLKGELVGTEKLGGIDGATLVFKANTVDKEVETCIITYTDENGYSVRIYLA